jgi:type IV secretion system protein VirD4
LILIGTYGALGLAAVIAVMRFPAVSIIGILILVYTRKPRWRGSGTSHGTAAPCSFVKLVSFGLIGNPIGLIVGKTGYIPPPSRKEALPAIFSRRISSENACRLFLAAYCSERFAKNQFLRLDSYCHGVVIAPTGRGKGVGFIIPNLLSISSNVVTIDLKGENFRIAARHRERKFGHRSVLIDPFAVCGQAKSDALNPLDFIDASAIDFLDRCRDLANALITRKGTEHEPHWNDSAELILTCFIAFVWACELIPEERNLITVRHLLVSKEKYTKSLEVMLKSDAAGGLIRNLAQAASWYTEKEGASVLTTLLRHTAWLESPAVAAVMKTSTFDPRELRWGKIDVYICIPPERLGSMPALPRTSIDTLLNVLARDGANEQNPNVLFLLDEYGHLGRIQSIENAVTLMRGYGIRLWFCFQSISQIQDCFGDRMSKFLDNMDSQLMFGLNAMETAEVVSKRAGEATIVTESFNHTRSQSRPTRTTINDTNGQQSTGTSITLSEAGRALFRADELLRAPEDFGILFHRNLPMIPVLLPKYYRDSAFRRGGTGVTRRVGWLALPPAVCMLSCALSFLVAAVEFPSLDERAGLPPISPRWEMPLRQNPIPRQGAPVPISPFATDPFQTFPAGREGGRAFP